MTSPLLPLILAGGAGTRLWPLSRETVPKPFIALPDGDTLLAKTARRAMQLQGVAALATITNRSYSRQVADVYAGIGSCAPRDPVFLLEPFGRNTAPAIALGALWAARARGDDAVLLVLPADHLIRDQVAFAAAVTLRASGHVKGASSPSALRPPTPRPGSGTSNAVMRGRCRAHSARLRRAPLRREASARDGAAILARPGIFSGTPACSAFTPRAILAAFERHAPRCSRPPRRSRGTLAGASATPRRSKSTPALFAAVPDISIDYAVMETAATRGEVVVVRGAFDWSDIGSWQAVAELSEPTRDGNRGQGERVAIATRGTYVHAEDRIVATVGVEDLVIVDTPDAVLVAHRDHLQRVKEVVGELKARGHEAYRPHRRWRGRGAPTRCCEEGPGFKIKRIEVKPGAALSLQLHHHRSEHWVVVSGHRARDAR